MFSTALSALRVTKFVFDIKLLRSGLLLWGGAQVLQESVLVTYTAPWKINL